MFITKSMLVETFKRLKKANVPKDEAMDALEIDSDQEYNTMDLYEALEEVYGV